MQAEPGGRHLEDVQVSKEDQYKDGEEYCRIDKPSAAKQQRHLHNRLGFEKHESRAQEEHPAAESQAPLGPLGHEQIDHRYPEDSQHDHRAYGEIGDQLAPDIKEWPVVVG